MGKARDLIGKKFGKLIVIEREGSNNYNAACWKCKCDCGNEIITQTGSLTTGNTQSCGCSYKELGIRRIKDLKGLRFGRLLVTEFIGSEKGRKAIWKCKCDCGNEVEVRGNSLTRKDTQSCGCFGKEQRIKAKMLEYGEASINDIINVYRINALKRGYEFMLTRYEFKDIILKNCYYCGKIPMQQSHRMRFNGNIVYNGIDRVDNSKGYTIDNVVPCCIQCNHAKTDYSIHEFKNWINTIITYQNLTNW